MVEDTISTRPPLVVLVETVRLPWLLPLFFPDDRRYELSSSLCCRGTFLTLIMIVTTMITPNVKASNRNPEEMTSY